MVMVRVVSRDAAGSHRMLVLVQRSCDQSREHCYVQDRRETQIKEGILVVLLSQHMIHRQSVVVLVVVVVMETKI